jgi:fructokinase
MLRPPVEIVGLGEVLWDLLPAGKALGGAPLNFAFHCHQLGHPAALVSRVGADALGDEIRAELRGRGLADDFVQRDPDHPTGTVGVSLDASGQPTYTIHEGSWDHLAWDGRLEGLIRGARAVCFGTLVQRHPAARGTVRRLLDAAGNALVVCDLNLRQHYYDRDVVERSIRASRWVKLNDAELLVLGDLLGLAGSGESALAADLRRRSGAELVALTRGENGCLVQTAGEEFEEPGVRVQVVDTVGAGDAFTAGLVCAALEGRPLREAARFANRLAARVAAAPGGTPRIDRAAVERDLTPAAPRR